MRALLPSSFLVVPTLLAITTSTFLHNPPIVIARQNNPLPAPENPGITTLIKSSNGTDITSSFQTFLYAPNDETEVTQSNLTDRSLTARQVDRYFRNINRCRHQPSLFQYSQCNHHPGQFDAMRRWNATCKLPPYTLDTRTITEYVSLIPTPRPDYTPRTDLLTILSSRAPAAETKSASMATVSQTARPQLPAASGESPLSRKSPNQPSNQTDSAISVTSPNA